MSIAKPNAFPLFPATAKSMSFYRGRSARTFKFLYQRIEHKAILTGICDNYRTAVVQV
jgi:hypothetical protein